MVQKRVMWLLMVKIITAAASPFINCFCVCLCVSRSSWGSLSALIRLFRQFMLRPSLLDSYLQAGVAGGTGLYTPPPQGEPWPGAVPALPMWGWTNLSNTARARCPAFITIIFVIVVIIAPGSGGKVQVCRLFISPLISSHVFVVFNLCIISKVVIFVSSGKNETSCVPEKLRKEGWTDGKKDRLKERRWEEEWPERRERLTEGKTSIALPMTNSRGNERQRQKKKSETEWNVGRGE